MKKLRVSLGDTLFLQHGPVAGEGSQFSCDDGWFFFCLLIYLFCPCLVFAPWISLPSHMVFVLLGVFLLEDLPTWAGLEGQCGIAALPTTRMSRCRLGLMPSVLLEKVKDSTQSK